MPPSVRPVFDPDDTTLKWLLQVYPSLDKTDLFECTLGPGEVATCVNIMIYLFTDLGLDLPLMIYMCQKSACCLHNCMKNLRYSFMYVCFAEGV